MTERVYKPSLEPNFIDITSKPRFWELDFLRGLCAILMVFDHFFYAAYGILKVYVWQWAGINFWQGLSEFASLYWHNDVRTILRYIVISLFFVICGISCTLSSNNLARGIKALFVALAITMITYLARIVSLDVLIVFGVIHMLAVAMLAYSLLDFVGKGIELGINKTAKSVEKRIRNKNSAKGSASAGEDGASSLGECSKKTAKISSETVAKWIRWLFPAAVGVILLIVFFATPLGYFGKRTATITMDGESIKSDYIYLFSNVVKEGSDGFKSFFSIFVSLKNYNMASSDYFPLLPYAPMVLIGSAVGRLVYHTRAKTALKRLNGKWHTPISFVGRHALIIYLLHTIVFVAFFYAAGGIISSIS